MVRAEINYLGIRDKNISRDALGVYMDFITKVENNGKYSVELPCHHTKTDISKYLKIHKNKYQKIIKELSDKELIKVDYVLKKVNILINPYYFKMSKITNNDVVNKFSLSSDILFKNGDNYIYFLYSNTKKLLYIGKSRDLLERMRSHKRDIDKIKWKTEICYFKYCEFESEADMDLYEIYYINKLHPKYNKQFVNNDKISVELPEKKSSNFKDFSLI